MPSWTTTELLENIRRKARVSSTDPSYTDAALLREADDAVSSVFLPAVSNLGQFHLVRTVDLTVTANQADYRIPERAAGDALVDVWLTDSDGNSGHSLPDVGLDRVHTYGTGEPIGYAIQGQVITLVPTPTTTTGRLRVKYTTRRGKFVATSSAAQITGIDTGTKTVTCSTVPSAWVNTSEYDLVQGMPGFDHLAIDQGVSAVVTGASGTLAFDNTLPTDLAVGDWVALAWETPVVQLPLEMHGVLELEVASKIAKAIGDYAVADHYKADVREAVAAWQNMAAPRNKLQPRKIINHHSFMRGGQARRWS